MCSPSEFKCVHQDAKFDATDGSTRTALSVNQLSYSERATLAVGDPHMTGFLGQKFDFTGLDGEYYCLIKDDHIQVSLVRSRLLPIYVEHNPARRVIPAANVIHVTQDLLIPNIPNLHSNCFECVLLGLTTSVQICFAARHEPSFFSARDNIHYRVVRAGNRRRGLRPRHCCRGQRPPQTRQLRPDGLSPCLAEGALSVLLDGEERLFTPGSVSLGEQVMVSAANLPGACRSFGFET